MLLVLAYVSAIKAKTTVQIKDLEYDQLLNALFYSYRLLEKKRVKKWVSEFEVKKQMNAFFATTDYANSLRPFPPTAPRL